LTSQVPLTKHPAQEDLLYSVARYPNPLTFKSLEKRPYETFVFYQQIRLQHLTTGRNLHSHHFTSPLSNSQEVSAFGEQGVCEFEFSSATNNLERYDFFSGEGDTGDVWVVVCESDFWLRDEPVMFKHVDTGKNILGPANLI